jgi:hypothetical protein
VARTARWLVRQLGFVAFAWRNRFPDYSKFCNRQRIPEVFARVTVLALIDFDPWRFFGLECLNAYASAKLPVRPEYAYVPAMHVHDVDEREQISI